MKSKNPTSFVFSFDFQKISKLHDYLSSRSEWKFSEPQNSLWQARKAKLVITAYKSAKITIQGEEAYDFITFVLEPEIANELLLNYNPQKEDHQEPFHPHAGVDECGKGDFFGPLVIACVYLNEEMNVKLKKAGIKDSKKMSDKSVQIAAHEIRKHCSPGIAVVSIGNEAYNRLYDQIMNLNKLLAWGHSRAIENLLEKIPACNEVISDKFSNERLIKDVLMKKGKKIKLIQKTKAESDTAVAAASIIAREHFLKKLNDLSKNLGILIPKGAGDKVNEIGRKILLERGKDFMKTIAKTHFKTMEKISSN